MIDANPLFKIFFFRNHNIGSFKVFCWFRWAKIKEKNRVTHEKDITTGCTPTTARLLPERTIGNILICYISIIYKPCAIVCHIPPSLLLPPLLHLKRQIGIETFIRPCTVHESNRNRTGESYSRAKNGLVSGFNLPFLHSRGLRNTPKRG